MQLDNPYAVTIANPKRKKRRAKSRRKKRTSYAPVVRHYITKRKRTRKNPISTGRKTMKNIQAYMLPAVGFFANNAVTKIVSGVIGKAGIGQDEIPAAPAAPAATGGSLVNRLISRVGATFIVHFAARALKMPALADGAAMNLVTGGIADVTAGMPGLARLTQLGQEEGELITGLGAEDLSDILGDDLGEDLIGAELIGEDGDDLGQDDEIEGLGFSPVGDDGGSALIG